ncbi:MAG: SRPBCC domain-containing protein [Saprospiraceae bacterium]
MEQKTKIQAEEGKQEIFITREFDLPVELLFRAYIEAEFVEEWMGTKVLLLESKKQGAYRFQTTDANGNILLQSIGVIHDLVLNQKITRTFEMENTPFPVQLEYLEFEKLTEQKSQLNMQVVYKSVADRDAILKLPFAFGINLAHNKLQETLNKLK